MFSNLRHIFDSKHNRDSKKSPIFSPLVRFYKKFSLYVAEFYSLPTANYKNLPPDDHLNFPSRTFTTADQAPAFNFLKFVFIRTLWLETADKF